MKYDDIIAKADAFADSYLSSDESDGLDDYSKVSIGFSEGFREGCRSLISLPETQAVLRLARECQASDPVLPEVKAIFAAFVKVAEAMV